MLRRSRPRGSRPAACSFWGRKNVFTRPGSKPEKLKRADVFRFAPAGSTGRRNTGAKSLCWGFKLQGLTCSFIYPPTSRCPSESTVSAGHWCSRSTRAARALRIAKIYVDFGRQRKATMIRKFLSPVPGQGLIQFLWQLLRLLDERADYRLGVLTCPSPETL